MGRFREGDLTSNGAKRRQLDRLYKHYRGICQICFKYCPREEASRDHVIELCKGGSSEDSNVVIAHKSCNNEKTNGAGVNRYIAVGVSNGKTAATALPDWWESIIAKQIEGCLIRQAAGQSVTGVVLRRFAKDYDFRSDL